MELLQPGDDVDQFRIRRLLGEGGMGQVYLARDQILGRLVALKLVRYGALDHHEVARFMDEARIMARFNHPNIVTVHAVGTHRGYPYIALEYIDGESLAERMQREELSVNEILRLGRAVSDALAHAHQQRILHCDLKPGNLVFARDGRVRVVDFGLAFDARVPGAQAGGGTPPYMAPEQETSLPLTDRVDIWALGVLLFECFDGERPGPAEASASDEPLFLRRDGIPPEVSRLVARALSRDPRKRPSAIECREIFDAALSPFRPLGGEESPFRGLLPFDEQHAAVFFGRESEISQLLERLRTETIIPLVGPSGAGKTSLVQAGLIPRLHAQGGWKILTFRPGRAPLRALAQRLLGPDDPDLEAVIERLRSMPSTTALRLSSIAGASGGKVLLVADQLEELFTHATGQEEVSQVLDALLSAADDVAEPVRVVLTVRDDFLARIKGLQSLFMLSPLDKDALRRTIIEPLAQVQYTFDAPDTVDAILAELKGGPGELPLLQFALRKLWDNRDQKRRVLLRATYDRIGGVAGALADHADATLRGLDDHEARATKGLLLRLVSPEGTRQLCDRSRLLDGFGIEGERALDRLIEARLLTPQDSTIELAHEALITRWRKLVGWLDEGREEQVLRAEIEAAASSWVRGGRQPGQTWSGRMLLSAQHRVAQLGITLAPASEEFLRAGVRRRRFGIGVVALFLAAIAAAAFFIMIRERQQTEERARSFANLGVAVVQLEAFDWDPQSLSLQPVDSVGLPSLSLELHQVAAGILIEPGAPLDTEKVRIEALTATVAMRRVFRVEAPGGDVFLRIDGRGRAGETCPPSWQRIQSWPGYAERKRDAEIILRLMVPSCRASSAGMVEVPAGEFVYGGPGEPPVEPGEQPEPERVIPMPRFMIDRTEISNAAFAPFIKLALLSGFDPPNYPSDDIVHGAALPDHPVTAISARTAEAYCRFFGKKLPLFTEWAKAVRGGLQLPGGTENPSPRRRFPWIGKAPPPGVNLKGSEERCALTCAVNRASAAPGVYGAVDLAGNVQEWGSGWERAGDDKLMPVFGGGLRSSVMDRLVSASAANMRDANYRDFETGARCVMPEKEY